MDIQALCTALEKKGYGVFRAKTAQQAQAHLLENIHHKTVGFGDSQTLAALQLPQLLAAENTVYDPQQCTTNGEFLTVAKQAMDTQIFLTSVNAISQTGELVNLDGTGNRVAGSLFGHEKVYFVVGKNKITPTLEAAIDRVRNIAAPANARRLGLDTPCAKAEPRCYDCASPQRICNAMVIHFHKLDDMEMEVVVIEEDLGL
ncbi:lactate utilization protein [Bengtsoniella intestinalis]|uniref:lactate utilization protein n=1 Tax=Bengtsoniella intestinalis TaxID=3073143 RepID=UPI00391F5193